MIDKVDRPHGNGACDLLLHRKAVRNRLLYEKELQERPLVMRSHPPGVEIEMTNRCNLACTQCLRSLGLKPYKLGDMDPDDYRRILAQFPYALHISLNGFGEPMMYRHFFEIVEYTRQERPWAKIGICSNGMLIDEGKAQRLMDCGLTELSISIDAAKPETYRRVRRGGRLDVVHENIRRLVRVKRAAKARFPMLGINFVMVNENEGELVPFVDQARELGVDFINRISWAAYNWGFRNHRTEQSYLDELRAAQQHLERTGVRCKSFPEISTRWTDPTRPFFCDFYWGSNFRVTHKGEVTLGCCTPFKETYSYGNILETPFETIWNGAGLRRNREMALKHIPPSKACASCDMFGRSFFAAKVEEASGCVPAGAVADSALS
ncbi:MAG TPA: radical SAM protein [Chthonomonadales bacterium]|nr:radical SAM protein [Chthonomonadales bacterium]